MRAKAKVAPPPFPSFFSPLPLVVCSCCLQGSGVDSARVFISNESMCNTMKICQIVISLSLSLSLSLSSLSFSLSLSLSINSNICNVFNVQHNQYMSNSEVRGSSTARAYTELNKLIPQAKPRCAQRRDEAERESVHRTKATHTTT